jgi:hypothetical protein
MNNKFNLEFSYSQISVFQTNMIDPFNNWNDVHVLQGFSWRPNSVSFKTLSEYGDAEITIELSDSIKISDGAIRSILVPFTVEEEIEIASITDSVVIEIPKGEYGLIFNAIPSTSNNSERYELIFVKSTFPEAKILIQDDELSPPSPLLMEATAAN